MALKLTSFADAGNIQKERLVMRATTNIDIGEYAVFLSKSSSDGGALSGPTSAFWFPDMEVKKGDLIVLYTKHGITSVKTLSTNRDAHFFYWGKPDAVWIDDTVGAAVLKVEDWDFQAAPFAPSSD